MGLLYHRKSDGLTVPFGCGSWGCPDCGPKKANKLAMAVRLVCVEKGLRYLNTLTLGGPIRDLRPDAKRAAVSAMWNPLRTWLSKEGYLVGGYYAGFEPQGDGTVHLHFATNRPIPYDVLSEAWSRLGGGFVWCSPVSEESTPEEVGRYLAKYLTKNAGEPTPWDVVHCTDPIGTRKKPWRRYLCSRDVGDFIRSVMDSHVESGDTWEVVQPVPRAGGVGYVPFAGRPRRLIIAGCPGHMMNEPWEGHCHHQAWRFDSLGDFVSPCHCPSPWLPQPDSGDRVLLVGDDRSLHAQGILAGAAANYERAVQSPPDTDLPQNLLDLHRLNGEWFERENARQEWEARMAVEGVESVSRPGRWRHGG